MASCQNDPAYSWPGPQIVLTHVCGRWRDIVQTFCAIVDTSDPMFLQLLDRSAHRPLEFCVSTHSTTGLYDCLTAVERRKVRVVNLIYQPTAVNQEDRAWCMWRFIQGPSARMLKSLTYYAGPGLLPTSRWCQVDQSHVPPVEKLTCHGPQELGTLCKAFSKTLTDLCLFGTGSFEVDFPEFVGALTQVPALTHLQLVRPGFISSSDNHPSYADLPNLQQLIIADCPWSLMELLDLLRYPSSATVILAYGIDRHGSPRWASFLADVIAEGIIRKLESSLQSDPASKIVRVGVGFHPTPYIRLLPSPSTSKCQPLLKLSLRPSETDVPSSPFDTLSLPPMPIMDIFCDVLRHILKSVRQSVLTLDVGPYDPPPAVGTRRHLSPFVGRNTRELRNFPPAILDVLGELENLQHIRWHVPDHPGAKVDVDTLRSVHAAFKKLRHVILTGCCFVSSSRGARQQEPPSGLYFDSGTSPTLDLDVKLEQLTLRSCEGLCACQLTRMYALAKTVHTDLTPLVECMPPSHHGLSHMFL